jgi:ABC-2 type transport system permease protein
MKAFAALVHREFLEHRGAFFIAPLVVTGLMVVVTLLPWATGWVGVMSGPVDREFIPPGIGKIYEVGYLIAGAVWLVYLIGALVFYAADAFWADRRNNALLFWKSMPQSDFKILLSKLVAGPTIFYALILAAAAVAGVWLYLVMVIGGPTAQLIPPPGAALLVYLNVTLVIAVTLLAAVLWYLPFFAYVGALSSLVGRWSLPLSALIPALVALAEAVLIIPGTPRGGHVWAYLTERLQFTMGWMDPDAYFASEAPLDGVGLVGSLLQRIDWLQMGLGIAVAVALVFAASEFRRRGVEG